MITNNDIANQLIKSLRPGLIRSIIPLHEYATVEYIQAGLITREFVEFFREHPYGDTGEFAWEVRKVDCLQNLHIWSK